MTNPTNRLVSFCGRKVSELSDLGKDPGHGDSVAAWTTVIIIIIASITGTLALWFDQISLVWASGALAVVGLLVGLALRKAGYGVGGKHAKNAGH